jgi:small-conductance mechanosensitive channel
MIATFYDRAGDQFGEFLPRLGGALLLLVIGLLAAIIFGRLVRGALVRAGLDRFADRSGTNSLLAQAGLGSSLCALVGTAVRLSIVVIAVFAALSLLGLEFLSESLNAGVLFIPRLLTALALLLIGVVLGAFARAWIERTSAQLDFPLALGTVAQVVVIALFALAAVLLGAVAITLALAFGLGSREIARSLSSGRFARADFRVGQTIRVDDLRGTIVRIDSAATTLRSSEGTVRVPNSVLVERVVVVEGAE